MKTAVDEIYGYFAAYSGCFVADTLVYTPAGMQKIQEINEGDMVYTMNMETMQKPATLPKFTMKGAKQSS